MEFSAKISEITDSFSNLCSTKSSKQIVSLERFIVEMEKRKGKKSWMRYLQEDGANIFKSVITVLSV